MCLSVCGSVDLFLPTCGTSGRRSSRSPFRQLTGTPTVDRYYHYSFFFFSSSSLSQPFLIEEVLGPKNLFSKAAKNLRIHPFPDPVGHFGAPWLLYLAKVVLGVQ